MSDRTLFAAFYLPLTDRRYGTVADLAVRAGMGHLQARSDLDCDVEVVSGTWADMYGVATTFDLRYFTILQIGFPQSGYFDLLDRTTLQPAPDSYTDRPPQHLVEAFVEACEALDPFFGMVTAYPRDDLPDYCAGLEDAVISQDDRTLLQEQSLLTYLSGAGARSDVLRSDFRVTRGGVVIIGPTRSETPQ